jgi:hypothetical protein
MGIWQAFSRVAKEDDLMAQWWPKPPIIAAALGSVQRLGFEGASRIRKELLMALRVIFAVYGALRSGNQDNTEAAIVTDALQGRLNNSPNGVVRINNANMGGDPAAGVQKHFGAIVEVDGVQRPFACLENQTIDFS